jgi:hypothetical protein
MLEIFLGRLPCWIPSVLILLPSCGMAKDAPGVLKTTPANHSENVPTDIGKIVIVFDPNRVREISNVEWKKTPVRERE